MTKLDATPHHYGPSFNRWLAPGSERSAKAIAPLVFDLLQPERVIDVGCGVGAWLSEFKRLGAAQVLGIDGGDAVGQLHIEADEMIRHDLRESLPTSERFDLALCLEVAEHLPASLAQDFVGRLTVLARAVLFSAAVPEQGGVGHVNEQWPEYWAQCFATLGYQAVDCIRDRVWDDPAVEFWYAQNVLLFVNDEVLREHASIRAAAAETSRRPLSRVHPVAYLSKAVHHRWHRRFVARLAPRLGRPLATVAAAAPRVRRSRDRVLRSVAPWLRR